MSSWEQWQAAQGAPPTEDPAPAFNQNTLPSNDGNPDLAPSAPAPAHAATTSHDVDPTAHDHNPSEQQQQQPAQDGMRILSADEVKKELNAMDPDTRQKTIEMGTKLKHIVQAAIIIHTATPGLSQMEFKEKILEKVGPMPVNEIDLPIHALKALYSKLYGKSAPPEHEEPLVALSKIFSPAGGGMMLDESVKQEKQDNLPGRVATPAPTAGMDSKEPAAVGAAAPSGGGTTAATAIAGGGGAKKLGVSREQYEKLLSKMNPEERKKHPKYDQVMKQYEQMDVSEKQRTQEAANKLRDFMRHSVQLYLGNPALSPETYRKRMKEKFGPVPDYQQWHLVTYNHLCTMYETINNVSHQTPHVMAALRALSQILPRPPPPGTAVAGTANASINNAGTPPPPPLGGVKAFVQQIRQREEQGQQQQGGGWQPGRGYTPVPRPSPEQSSPEEGEEELDFNDAMVGNIGKEPDYDQLPETLNVSCNGRNGIFFVRTQTIRCLCQFCEDVAASHNVSHLIISVSEFERHCGMAQSKKWKYTIRVMDPPVMTLGQWMDENGFNIRYTKGQIDDVKLRRAEKKREREAAAEARAAEKANGGDGLYYPSVGGGGYNLNSYQGQYQHHQPSSYQGDLLRTAPALNPAARAPAAAAPSTHPAPPAAVNRRKATLKITQQHNVGDGGGALDAAPEIRPGTGGRSQRQRKQPTWMKQTVDPNAVLGGKSTVQRTDEYGDDNDDVPVLRGAGQLHFPRGRPENPAPAKRARLDSDALLEAEIDAALSRGLQPEVHGWRVDDSNQLNVTVHLGGVVFSGVLPARVPREASSPAIYAAVMRENQRLAAANAPAAPTSAVVSRPPLPQQHLRRNDSGSDGVGGGVTGLYDDDMDDLPPVPPTAARTISTALGNINDHVQAALPDGVGSATVAAAAAAAVAATVPLGGAAAVIIESAVNKAVKKELRMDERRAEAASEYERLLVDGPPPGTKCAMCHFEEVDTVPRGARDPSTGKSQVGLGGLILVRTSAVTNAWVHDQCARWSPDVYDPTGEGILEGIAAAVRRGRMLRCKICGQKGATLGCLKKTCKCSYHLPCARDHGCLLNMEPYAVACPEHVDQLPDGLSLKLGFKRGKRVRSEGMMMTMAPPAAQLPFPGPATLGSGGGGLGGYLGGGGGEQQQQQQQPYNAMGGLGAPRNYPPSDQQQQQYMPPPQ